MILYRFEVVYLKKKSMSLIYLSVLLLFLGAASAGISYAYSSVKYWEGLIYPGVYIENINVSGMTKDKAADIIKHNYSSDILDNKINVETPDKTYTIEYSKLDTKYNIDEVVNQALSYGKNLSMFSKYKLIKKSQPKELKLSFSYNKDKLIAFLNSIEKETNKDAVNATLKMAGGRFSVTPDKTGAKLEKDKLQQEISDAVTAGSKSDINEKAVYDTVTAAVTADKLSTVDTRIAGFNTEFASRSSAERANNINLATKAINGTVLMPGDVFSFNNIVGKRTAEKGYQSAPVIIDNKVDYDFGGGICQVSSTLYNAILRTTMKSTERVHHTIPSSYVNIGEDATVDFGNIDYKFKNTLSYPIYLEGYTSGGNVYFNLYSSSSILGKTYDISNEVYATVQAGTKYIDDPTMLAGQTEVVQKPYTGYKVKVYKKTMQNGAVVTQELVSDDYYRPVDGVIKRGTKKK
jgi:vancomycin resistance protein YoaR